MAHFQFQTCKHAYESFWSRFITICQKCAPVWPRQSAIFEFRGEDQRVKLHLSRCIHLQKWPYKKFSSRNIDILVNAVEHFDAKTSEMLDSTVNVSYFKIEDRRPFVVENIHYDFKFPPEICHPFFHAQLTPCNVDWKNCETFMDNYDVRSLSRFRENRTKVEGLRIPTPHMNLISVLFSLAADHLGSGILKELRDSTIQIANLPKVNFSTLSRRICDDTHSYRSLHWYPL